MPTTDIQYILVASTRLERHPRTGLKQHVGVDLLRITGHGRRADAVWITARHVGWARTLAGAEEMLLKQERAMSQSQAEPPESTP